jgi:DNA-binding transcriptional LysR family regulator
MSQITLSQLRTFWAAAHNPSLTRAAKQLGVSQPSLSQQLAKLERAIGTRLFERSGAELRLTDAGSFLLRRAEAVLAQVDEAEAGLGAFAQGRRGRIAIGALNSLARTLVPAAWRLALARLPGIELDLHELSPREALDQLYGRILQIALLSVESMAGHRHSFSVLPLAQDPHVLVVPESLDLCGITDPVRQLPPEMLAVLSRVIQFNFGTQHTQRVEAWWRRVLPRHEMVATCRTYDTALALVEAGLGVAQMPLLTVQQGRRLLGRVRLYDAGIAPRRIVAVVPAQYRRLAPFDIFLSELEAAGRGLELLTPLPTPPFLREAALDAAPP